ncbi:hypothetical protein GH714_030505 [Hevea brasiliensis]|uniref:Uncharacterized protein n=1 Tax=Hevea brasiliensis TaxID=3981 RepID=A0A6A6LWE5_HEVBR|nr:hypothetical protein GH714_030505 [Hevea brasiliensis]
MEKDSLKSNNNVNTNNTHKTGDDLLRAVSETTKQTTSDFVLQWGNRKRLRNSENSSAMRGQSNGGVRGLASPDKGTHDRRGITTANNYAHHNHNSNHDNNSKSGASSETAHDSKKGGSSSGSGEAAPTVWPPKFVIALTNKEKEEDFIAFKGSKLPQRPKKRAKFIQRTLNLVSPGSWLCDLTLERYEVREKKISKKENKKAFRFELVKRNDGASNPGRRLHGCRNYGTSNYCGYFQWYDDPFLLRATQVISGLLRRIDRHDLDLQAARGKERKWMYIALCLALYIVVEKVFIR